VDVGHAASVPASESRVCADFVPNLHTRPVPIRPWRLIRSEHVFRDRWYRLRRDTVELVDGSIVDDYFVSERDDIAQVVALTPDQNVVFVRQYKHGIGEITLELPGGLVDADETPGEAARRELAEETGYDAPRLEPLGGLVHDPPKTTNRIHGFLALDAARTREPEPDATEEIEVVLLPLAEVEQRLGAHELDVSSTVALLYRALEALSRRPG
jgi:ADP-ribose diphosphatase